MPEILILIHGNRFIFNDKNWINKKISQWMKRSGSSPLKSISLLPDICWCGCYMIQYSICNDISVFCKSFNLETENIF